MVWHLSVYRLTSPQAFRHSDTDIAHRLPEQRQVLAFEQAIAEARVANQLLLIQHATLNDYVQWLEHCDMWA